MGAASRPRGRNPLLVAGMDQRRGRGPGLFTPRKLPSRNFSISGQTQDSNGAPLPFCTVKLFESATDTELGQTLSDGLGFYSFEIGINSGSFYVLAYLAGAPDVMGTTVNTLEAT